MTLVWSATAAIEVALQDGVPSESKGQPIGHSPCHKHDTFGQPYPPQCLFIWSGARCEVYWDKENDADWEGER